MANSTACGWTCKCGQQYAAGNSAAAEAGWEEHKRSCVDAQAIDTRNEIAEAVLILSESQKGRDAMRHLLAWLDDSGCSLDGRNQDCCTSLLDAAWAGYAGSVRDAMREALD